MSDLIYFDNNATTKVDDKVVEAILPFFSQKYGNASSKLHAYGWEAEAAVDKAREQVADLIGAEPNEIVFTSGATEAINMALCGIYRTYKSKGKHIITVKSEHKAVLDTCRFLEEYEGAEITYLNVDKEGLVSPEELRRSIRKDTILICIMAANNETGVIQPIEEIGQLAREHKILFFSDTTQYAGKMMLDVNETPIDILCVSAHKMHGPKGVGAIYLKRKNPRVNCLPFMYGGGQESGRRAGTLNVPGIVGLGLCSQMAKSEIWETNTHVSKLRAYLEHQLLEIPGLRINGSTRTRLYNTSNITFPESVNIKELLKSYAFSSGSACTSGSGELSHVLKAMGLNDEEIKNSYRFSFSKYNTIDEVKKVINNLFTINKFLF
ncbi:MAG: cysteine desulfurase [Bacteroidia bacterium]|nr:cysteine desulfurase [Bacteroidia bacterium]